MCIRYYCACYASVRQVKKWERAKASNLVTQLVTCHFALPSSKLGSQHCSVSLIWLVPTHGRGHSILSFVMPLLLQLHLSSSVLSILGCVSFARGIITKPTRVVCSVTEDCRPAARAPPWPPAPRRAPAWGRPCRPRGSPPSPSRASPGAAPEI